MTFQKGVSGNPAGKPPGKQSISKKLREMLRELTVITNEDGTVERTTYEDLFVKRVIQKAIKDGDSTMISLIWAYMEGRPVDRKALTDTDGDDILVPNEKIRELGNALIELQRARTTGSHGVTSVPVVLAESNQDING